VDELKKTPLHEEHKKLGGKLVPFGGWDMPVQYTSITEEHINVRENVGIFDVSHMGEIEIRGKDALHYTSYLVTNDLFVYKISDDFVLLVVNASNYEKDLDWVLQNKKGFDVDILGKSFEYGEVAVQGPKAEELLTPFLKGEICR